MSSYIKEEWKILKDSHPPVIYSGEQLLNLEVIAEVYGINETQNHNAKLIAAAPDLLEALIEITEAKGTYSLDRLEHASNTIRDMVLLAEEAIKKATL